MPGTLGTQGRCCQGLRDHVRTLLLGAWDESKTSCLSRRVSDPEPWAGQSSPASVRAGGGDTWAAGSSSGKSGPGDHLLCTLLTSPAFLMVILSQIVRQGDGHNIQYTVPYYYTVV